MSVFKQGDLVFDQEGYAYEYHAQAGDIHVVRSRWTYHDDYNDHEEESESTGGYLILDRVFASEPVKKLGDVAQETERKLEELKEVKRKILFAEDRLKKLEVEVEQRQAHLREFWGGVFDTILMVLKAEADGYIELGDYGRLSVSTGPLYLQIHKGELRTMSLDHFGDDPEFVGAVPFRECDKLKVASRVFQQALENEEDPGDYFLYNLNRFATNVGIDPPSVVAEGAKRYSAEYAAERRADLLRQRKNIDEMLKKYGGGE